ncbi:MAG: twin-arginine translocase TatA/TatE family subunit [Nibricoccus sp.]
MPSHTHLFAFLDVGGPEVLMIMALVLFLFGGKKLPEFARGLGKSIREFKKATAGVEDEIKRAINTIEEPDEPKPSSTPKLPPAPAPSPAQKNPFLPPPPPPPEKPTET